MNNDKKSFLLYVDYRQHLELLSDAERGQLLMALFDYAEFETIPEFDGMLKMAFSFIKSQMDRDSAKFIARCEKNRENIAKRWNKGNTNEYDRIQSDTKHTDTENDTDNENDTDKGNTPKAPKGASDRSTYASRFILFWQAYPKKTGKGAAEKSFVKWKPDDALLDLILKAIEIQKQSEQWKKNNGQFIPNPATWLNQKRWEDETPPPSNTTGNIFADMLREKQDERN